jgi:hypothetical protein
VRILGAAILAVGLIMLLFGVGAPLYGVWFRIQSEQVSGTVVDVPLRAYSDGNAYCPVIEYRSRGENFRHYSDICSWPAAYEVGDQVRMFVDRNDPERVQMGSFFGIWFVPIMMLLFGGIMSFVGLSLFSPEFLFGGGFQRLFGKPKQ